MAAIELDGLTKDYGDVVAADELTLSVDHGEIFGYLGPNGAGKTTTIRMLLGFISPTAGTARVLGQDVADRRGLIEVKRRLGYLSDEPGFDEEATGEEVLDLHGSIKGESRREELLESFDPPLERQVRDYSRGNVQKLGIVATFMHDPDLVILDEPTSGLDPLMKQRFSDFLRAERAGGLTVFLSSHVLSEVRRLCDRVGIIREGRLVTVDPIESLLDRSGKSVRINSREPFSLESIRQLSGVHGLEVGGGDDARRERGDESVNEASTGAADEGSPGTTGDGANTQAAGTTGTPPLGRKPSVTECTFTYTGDINHLLTTVRDVDLLDLAIEEAPIEEVFMRFYDADEGANSSAGGDEGPTPATQSDTAASDGVGDGESANSGGAFDA